MYNLITMLYNLKSITITIKNNIENNTNQKKECQRVEYV